MNTQVTYTNVRPISVPGWLGTIIIALVPLLNVAVLLYWSFSRRADPNRRNFSRAGLIVIAAVVVIVVSVLWYLVLSIDPNERIKAFLMME